jgi:branched-chain amino acid transport system ATP-binding protein
VTPADRAAAAAPTGPSAARLDVDGLGVRYGHVTALQSVSFSVEPGTVLALLGPNGAGKSSLANTLSGVVRPAAGSITLDGRSIDGLSSHARVRLGIGHLPDSRAIFPSLTVAENLRMFFRGSRLAVRNNVETAYQMFPQLAQRKRLPARKLSGGEQQMLAFSRLIVAPPRLLIVDELSHGLAPGIVAKLFASLNSLRGVCSMLVVEQFVTRAVQLADTVLVLSHGEVQHYGPAKSFTPEMAAQLYGLHAAAR